MRRTFYLISSLLLLFLAVSCGSGSETAVPDQPTNTVETEKETQTVAAKPQLIEFYADW